MKIILTVPGYTDVVFDSYEDLNFIWEIMENYKDCSIKLVYDDDDENNKEISENIDTVVKDSIEASYDIPKNIVFTQRFQDRLSREIEDILNSIYPDGFSIEDVFYEDIDEDKENMKVKIKLKANNEVTQEKLKYMDQNIAYIINDLIDYYK